MLNHRRLGPPSMNQSLPSGARLIAFRRLVGDCPAGGAISVKLKVLGSRRPSLPPTRWVTQAFPSKSTVTSCGSALLFGSSYSTAIYLVASPLTKIRGKRLLGSGAGLPLPPGPEKFAIT